MMDALNAIVWILLIIYVVPLLILPIWPIQKTIPIKTRKAHGWSVIIPMRNEAEHVNRLFDEFDAQSGEQVFEVIFVNDHSQDETLSLLEALPSSSRFTHQVLSLNESRGKKAAIKKAIAVSTYNYCITVDADTFRNKNWFDAISNGPEGDMLILPLWVKPSIGSIWATLQVTEQQFLQSLSYFSAKIGYPILCNGANLAFRKPENYALNLHASGDDIFLLEQFILERRKIEYYNSPESAVFTLAVTNMKDFINQRWRWQSKNFLYKAKRFYVFGLWVLCGMLAVMLCLWLTIFRMCSLWELLSVAAIKGLAEIIFLRYGLNVLNASQIHQMFRMKDKISMIEKYFCLLFYNIVAWIVLLGGLFMKPKWKGRSI